jgi:hypothetical protein
VGAKFVTPQRERTEESSSRPRRQLMEAESVEIPLGMPSRESEMAPLWVSTNQFYILILLMLMSEEIEVYILILLMLMSKFG